MITVGIECESIENEQWGVGRIVTQLLQELARRPELEKEFRFYLYFKKQIPKMAFLDNKIFVKKVVRLPLISKFLDYIAPASFSIYYYVLLPIRILFDNLDITFYPNYMLPILHRGKSIVMLSEDVHYEAHHGSNPFRYRLAYRIFCSWAAKYATKIVTMSHTSKKRVAGLFDIELERIETNYLGNVIKNRIFKKEKGDYILYVAQAFPRRHLKEIMLAIESLAPEFPSLRLIAVGYDKYRPQIIQKTANAINASGGREIIDYREYVSEEELAKLYTSAISLIYVSEQEAFGLPPVEGLASGTVPIVADNELSKELFGEQAFFVKNPISVKSIADAIKLSIINIEKREDIIANAQSVVARYTWPKYAERFISIVKKTV